MIRVMVAVVIVLLGAELVRGEAYLGKGVARETLRIEATWRDGKRERDVPVVICFPKAIGEREKLPVIIFSHGLGGQPLAYDAYGKLWASRGYMVVLPQHAGSDTQAVLGKGRRTAEQNLQSFVDRTGDVRFVIDQVEAIDAGKLAGKQYEVLKDKLDTKKIGMSGHSFGAITTQAMVGQVYDRPVKGQTFVDGRIAAGIAMSPYPPLQKKEDLDVAFGSIKVPVLYMSGTLDTVASKAEDRRIPFDHSKAAGTIFLNFSGGLHSTFVPVEIGRSSAGKAEFQKLIREATTAYWDAYLKGDAKAREWLQTELAKEVGAKGKVEAK